MAYYSESGYCAEDVMRRPHAEPGYYHGEGGERYAVRKEYEEIDEVARAGRGHYGHLGRSGSHHHHVGHGGHEGSCHGHLGGEYREQQHLHGHGHGGRHYDACESRRRPVLRLSSDRTVEVNGHGHHQHDITPGLLPSS